MEQYNDRDFGLMKEIANTLSESNRGKFRPLDRHREARDRAAKKKKATKMAKASRRKNRR